MGNFYVFNIATICIHGEEYWHSIKNAEDFTMKQMFDISEKLVSEQDEIYGVKTINWENSSWKYLSSIGDEQSSIFNSQKLTYFQILYCVLVR